MDWFNNLVQGETYGIPNGMGGQRPMGLLDNPALQMGLGILANNQGNYGSFGAAVGKGGLMGMHNIQRQKVLDTQAKLQQRQMDEYDRKVQEQQAAREAQARLLSGQQGYMTEQEVPFTRTENVPMPAQEVAQAPNFNTMPQTINVVNKVPKFDNSKYMQDMVAAGYGDEILKNQLNRQFATREPMKLGKGDRLIDPTTYKELVGAVPDAEEINPNKPFLVVDGKVVPNKAYQDYELAKARSGAAINNVSVNTGQKGFDNTLKLRGEFRSEPIYKAHQEVKSAHSQITAALKQATPAGDLAGATKLMKILDPGSVVRESELGMAMAASGAMDRMQNYATNVINGTKLTPTQRKDFQALSDALLNESSKQYNTKRTEYKGIADRNELPEADVLGSPDVIPSKPRSKADILKSYGVR